MMIKILYLLLIIILGFGLQTKAQSQSSVDSSKIFVKVDKSPTFPGGEAKFIGYLSTRLQFTRELYNKYKDKKVVLYIVIEPDGRVSDVKIWRGLAELDVQIWKAVKSSPNWNPGEKDGQKVRVRNEISVFIKDYEPAT